MSYLSPYDNVWTKSTYPSNDLQISFVDLSVKELGVEDGANGFAVKVYPNPAKDRLQIESDNNIAELRVTNTVGQLILSTKVDDNQYTLSTSNLESGVYILELTIDGERRTMRFAVR